MKKVVALLLLCATVSEALVVPLAPSLRSASSSVRSVSISSVVSPPPAATTADNDDKSLLIDGLAFMAGVTDVACFSRFSSYCNMMSGTTIQLAASLGALNALDALYYAGVLLCFVAGVGGYRVVDLRRQRRLTPSAVAPAVLLLFIASDVLLGRPRLSRVALYTLATACGLINAVSSEVTGTITSMVTGHVQRLSNALVDWAAPGELASATRAAASRSLRVLATFILGVVAGVRVFGTFGKPLPTYCFTSLGLIYAAMLTLHDRPNFGASVRMPRLFWNRAAACEQDIYGADCDLEEVEEEPEEAVR